MCETNQCPTGTTTLDPSLIQRFDVDRGATKLAHFINVSTAEVAGITRAIGKHSVHDLDPQDLVALTREASELSGVQRPRVPRGH